MSAARRTCEDVLLIAGGVGITPMRALSRPFRFAPAQDLTLVYRERDVDHVLFRYEHVLFRYELDRIASELRDRHEERFGW